MNQIELLKQLLNISNPLPAHEVTVVEDLVFDDEPVQAVLYGLLLQPPTPASIFQPARELLRKTKSDGEITSEASLQACLQFLDTGHPVSQQLFVSIARVVGSLLPVWPRPLSRDMPPSVGPLMERLWRYAHEHGDDERKYIAGVRLWEWYERVTLHADARSVLLVLEEIQRRRSKHSALPGIINNFAFQFQKERMWKEAAFHFDRAARLANELRQTLDYANSRANYWGCRFELEGAEICELMVPELQRLGDILREAKWQTGERKVLVLLARVEATLGNPQAAVPLIERAIEIDESQNSMYLEHDRELLEEFQRQSMRTANIQLNR